MVQRACLPILVLINFARRFWGRYLKQNVKGLSEARIDSRERVDRGGRVDRERKASEDAPIGYKMMNRLYLAGQLRLSFLTVYGTAGEKEGGDEIAYLAQVRTGISTPNRAHS
jgi:hypothetical protein